MPSARRIPDPHTGRRTLSIPGIGYHKPTNRYRIQVRSNGKVVSEYFAVTAGGLWMAKRRRAELDHRPPVWTPASTGEQFRAELRGFIDDFDLDPEQIDNEFWEAWRRASSAAELKEMLVSIGVPTDFLNDNPDILVDLSNGHSPQKINAEWLNAVPRKKREEALAQEMFGIELAGRRAVRRNDAAFTVAQIGQRYRDWYANQHVDMEEAKRRAEAANAAPDSRKASKQKAHPPADESMAALRAAQGAHPLPGARVLLRRVRRLRRRHPGR